jgi:UDP-N-acetyl-2-amino-2-deoxyglucuronate dehydrogenase
MQIIHGRYEIMGKWRVAVIGCGMFANKQYFPYIPTAADACCVAACDIVEERARQACEEYGIPEWYSNVDDLIDKCNFDIAINATNIPAHHEINMKLLKAGKHLISQKPAALTVGDMDMQIEQAKKSNVLFTCVPIHMMRPDIRMAVQMIKDGAIGRIHSVKCTAAHGGPEYWQYREADPSWFYEPGAGALYDMGVHGIQQVTGIMGPARRLVAMAATSVKQRRVRSGAYDGKLIQSDKIPDNYIISFDFGDDRIGLVSTGFCELATRCVPLEIFGSEGTISFDPPGYIFANPKVYIDSLDRGIRGWVEPMDWLRPHPGSFNQCCCLTDIVHALETGEPPILSPYHARHIIEILCAIPKSLEIGGYVELHTTF